MTSCHVQEKLIFTPIKLVDTFEYKYSTNFVEKELEVEQGVFLNGLHFKVNNPKGLILYFHGNDGSLERWGAVYEDFVKHGYDVLMYDYRGYGKSDNEIKSQKELYQDAQLIYDAAKKLYEEQNIIVYGRSIGTGVASSLLEENNPKLLVLETPYYNMLHLIKSHFRYPVGASLILRYRLANNKHIKNAEVPVYLFHGTADETIPYSHTVKLSNIEGSEITLITIPEGEHSNLSEYDLFQKELKELLKD
jgi:alpha-beta hydrolase superfamily lysophospholipase